MRSRPVVMLPTQRELRDDRRRSAGLLVVFGVWLLDYKLHVDDPVGAVAVHFMNGVWGTIAVGLFASPGTPGFETAGLNAAGLFYGGGVSQLGVQLIGVIAVGAWTAVTISIVFYVIKATIGLRVSPEEEIAGLDSTEHGLENAYADFTPAIDSIAAAASYSVPAGDVPMEQAVPVVEKTVVDAKPDKNKFTKISIVAKESKFDELKEAMNSIGITGMTVTKVLGCGMQKGRPEYYRGVEVNVTLIPKMKLEMVVCKVPVRTVIETAKRVLYTGHIGDGKIFVYDVENVVKIRTGEEGYNALQDVE